MQAMISGASVPKSGQWLGWRRFATNRVIGIAIALFAITLVALVWAAVFATVRADRANTILAANQRNAGLAIAVEQYTRRTIENADDIVRYLIREYARTGAKMDLAEFVAAYTIASKALAGVVLADEDGHVVTTSRGRTPAQAVNIADREHFRVHVARDSVNPVIGKPVVGRISGKALIPISRRINKADGTFGGVGMALIEPSVLTDVLQEAVNRPRDVVSLIGFDGITRARLKGRVPSSGQDIRTSVLFQRKTSARFGDFQEKGQLDGIPRLYSYRRLPDYELIVTVGVAEADVMADADLRRTRSIWAAGFATALIGAFAVLLLLALESQRKAAAELAGRSARLQLASRQLMSLRETEGRRLGRELHDRVGANLSALLLSLEVLRGRLSPGSAPEIVVGLDGCEYLLRESIAHVRDVLGDLRPPALDELGLLAALHHHAGAVARLGNVEIGVEGSEPAPRLPAEVEIALFRIAQEAIGNASRHAQARRIRITLHQEGEEAILTIADDGKGFDAGLLTPGSPSLGLVTMRERAEAMDAWFGIEAAPGKGTRITVSVPHCSATHAPA